MDRLRSWLQGEFAKTARTVIYSWIFLISIVLLYLRFEEWQIDRDARRIVEVEKKAVETTGVKALTPTQRDLIAGKELLRRLRQGNLVLFARHFHTRHKGITDDSRKFEHKKLEISDFDDCSWQRPLSDAGRMSAESVRFAWSKLNIPIGKVYASPYCRCVETARLLSGRNVVRTLDLLYRKGELTVAEHLAKLIPYLATRVKASDSGNTLLVAHRTQMDSLALIGEGDIYVFEPLGENRFNLIAQVEMSEWMLSTFRPDFLGVHNLGETFQATESSNL